MSDNTHGYTGFHLLMALAGGVALGAGVAYLTAPQSGSDTRHDILNRAEAIRSKAASLPHAIAGAFLGQPRVRAMRVDRSARMAKRLIS